MADIGDLLAGADDDPGSRAPAQKQIDDVLSAPLAEKLAELLLLPRDASRLDL
jgi:hypothetical protein